MANYLGLARRSEEHLAESLRAVADRHGHEPDVLQETRMLAAWSDENNEVLEPLANDGSGRYRKASYDLAHETPVKSPWLVAPDNAVVIIDGMFLHRRAFAQSRTRKVWDISVWLDVPFEETYRRLHERGTANQDPLDPSNARYYEGQLLYLRECRPADKADLVVDNSAPRTPIDDL